jgi:hypothetical protein
MTPIERLAETPEVEEALAKFAHYAGYDEGNPEGLIRVILAAMLEPSEECVQWVHEAIFDSPVNATGYDQTRAQIAAHIGYWLGE